MDLRIQTRMSDPSHCRPKWVSAGRPLQERTIELAWRRPRYGYNPRRHAIRAALCPTAQSFLSSATSSASQLIRDAYTPTYNYRLRFLTDPRQRTDRLPRYYERLRQPVPRGLPVGHR